MACALVSVDVPATIRNQTALDESDVPITGSGKSVSGHLFPVLDDAQC
jgi:hypothetical protein